MPTFEELKPFLGEDYAVDGDPEGLVFFNAKPTLEATETSITWIGDNRDDQVELAERTRARLIICGRALPRAGNACLIRVENPRLVFLRVIAGLFTTSPEWGIHPTAVVHPKASIHPRSWIGPLCQLGECVIGEGCVLVGRCVLYDHVTLGERVVLHAGVVLGSDGFGYSRNGAGHYEKFPHIGAVEIGDDVEIGANSCVDRGTLGNTTIRRGTKIGNLVTVGHNVEIGEDVIITGGVTVSGSTILKSGSWIAPGATLSNRITVGDDATVGIGATVVGDVAAGSKVAARPAQALPESFWSNPSERR